MIISPMLKTAIKAARCAARIINRASFNLSILKITKKQRNDFVTEIDKNAEAAIIDILGNAYPDHAILAEESGTSANLNDDNENIWIIDPLDGTMNFIHGFPQYCISIALQQRGQLTQAVIYDPVRNELFTASRGAGAYLNDKRIRVSQCDKINAALIGNGFLFNDHANVDDHLNMVRTMITHCTGLRNPGAAALTLAYVAAGRLDGFFETRLKPWDIAAGSLLVLEAGGRVGNFLGEANYLYQGEIIAGSPKVFAEQVQLLSRFAERDQKI